MGKLLNISMLCALIIAMFGACANGASQTLNFHFYVHSRTRGPNQTSYEIARIDDVTSNSQTLFGLVRVVDDTIRVNPGPDSRILGRVQGFVAYADLENIGPIVNLNFVFTSGTYNGSVLVVSGKAPAFEYQRELAIVGGTGFFLTARGRAIAILWSADDNGYYVIEYFLTVVVDDIDTSSKVISSM